MSKEEARDLLRKDAKKIEEHLAEKTRSQFTHESMDRWAGQLCICFEEYCKHIIQMQNKNTKDPIAFIHFSWLRTNIMRRDYKLRIDSYSKDWYLDRVECTCEYDATEIYACLDEFGNQLELERRKYVHRLSAADAKMIVLEESIKYNIVVAILVTGAMRQIIRLPILQQVLKDKAFSIRVGEFHDKSVEVYPRGQNGSRMEN